MAHPNHITELQAVDFAVGGVIVRAYEGLGMSGPAAWKRFLSRSNTSKIYRTDNESPRDLLRRIAEHQSKDGQPPPDLPVIAYYRSPGLTGDMNQKPIAFEVTRYTDDDRPLRLTTIPVTLSYSFLFCAWDKPTLDKLTVAWFCYIGQFGRRHSRFIVKHTLGDELIAIPASLTATRDILASNAGADQAEGRLWAARTLVEVNTQVLYGREIPEETERFYGISRVIV